MHLPVLLRGLPQPNWKTNRETTTLEYTDTRKVCVEDSQPSQHTTESIYYTPWNYPCNVLVQYSIVVVSKYKNKASVTPFHNVVHRPRGSSLLKEYHSQWGNSFCKSTKKKTIIATFPQLFLLFLSFPPPCQRLQVWRCEAIQSATYLYKV